jgi:glycosyltransferase involved in cell wall biosynthesis
MKIALVHDYLVQRGGAEKVLEVFAELFPYAPIYTLVYDKEAMQGLFANRDIHTSFLQRFAWVRKHHRLFPPLMPLAIEQFDFSAYDIVLSDSASYAKGIITRPKTLHLCYMHTPMRYAWDDCQKYTQDFGFPQFITKFVPFFMNPIRLWDKLSADRVDDFLANSNFVAKRIRKYYRKEVTVIHPPVNVHRFFVSPTQEPYFLMVGRLIAYKRHDIAIAAFNELGLPLKIIGRGPELARLQKMAKSNIEFLGRVSDEELPGYYAKCQAFIFPQEEDFGIVAIEALASGRPLIAFQGGDIVEHLKDESMGVLFEKQTKESLIEAVNQFRLHAYNGEHIKGSVQKFDKERFKATVKEYIERTLKEHLAKQADDHAHF